MAKAKALISCAVTAQLICVFVFAYANHWFSCAMAQNFMQKCIQSPEKEAITSLLRFEIDSDWVNIQLSPVEPRVECRNKQVTG